MSQKQITTPNRVSKYAIKHRISLDKLNEAINENDSTNETDTTSENSEDKVNTYNRYSKPNSYRKPFSKDKNDGIPASASSFPPHIVNVALLVKNNSEIRRFTAIGILNYLLQKGEIEGEHRYVTFKWNKFAVKCNGLMREYSYTEQFFINALVAAFTSFSASAQRTIDIFCNKELSISIHQAVNNEQIAKIIDMNENHTESVGEIEEDNE